MRMRTEFRPARRHPGLISAGFAATVALMLATGGAAHAERLEAAVIGNVNYPAAPLANSGRDATTVAQALAEAGFSVTTYFDVTRAEMDGVLAKIDAQFADADIGVLYYAGHAFQFNGQNQLLAVDIDALTREQIEAKRIPLDSFLAATGTQASGEGAGGLRLIIIDACRTDPFSAVDNVFSRGIAFEESGDAQTLIAYSTSAGELAYDGPRGGNGPYALALARALRSDGVTVSSAMRSVRRDVRVATDGLQIPWVVGSIETDPDFGLAPQHAAVVPADTGDLPPVDEVVWYFVRDDLTPSSLAEFVSVFPSSRHADEANQRMRDIAAVQDDASRQIVLEQVPVSGETLRQLAEAEQQVAVKTVYSADTSIPAELFDIWPDTLPQAPGGLAEIVTQCDILAADPQDPQRIAPPIRDGLVNLRSAARACGAALATDPENPRLLFQFGRILDIAGRYDWARGYYNRAATGDYSAALVNLGYMAIQGRGSDRDYDAAGRYYRKAAAMGNLRARTNVGTMYVRGQGIRAQPEEGVLWYRLASGMGWANAQNALADLYRKGIGVEADPRAAAALYLLAAENGQREAMNSLGRSYIQGWGVEPDRVKAHEWFERAIAAGDRFAPRFYAQDLIAGGEAATDPQRVVDLFQLAADRGFYDGYSELAQLYLDGTLVTADPAAAYLNARLAEIGEVDDAAALVARAREKLDGATADRIEADLEQRRRLNGL